MVCVRCKKRTAVVFIQRMEGGKPIQEGYCLTCAKALNIGPVNDLMQRFGVSDQDLETMEERMSSFLEEASQAAGDMMPAEEEDFVPGGSPAFPFGLGGMMGASNGQNDGGHGRGKKDKKEKQPQRKFLDTYCENLTQKARDGKTDRIIGRDREI